MMQGESWPWGAENGLEPGVVSRRKVRTGSEGEDCELLRSLNTPE